MIMYRLTKNQLVSPKFTDNLFRGWRFWIWSRIFTTPILSVPKSRSKFSKYGENDFVFFSNELNWFNAWKMYKSNFNVSVNVCSKNIWQFLILTRFDCSLKSKKKNSWLQGWFWGIMCSVLWKLVPKSDSVYSN